MRLLIIFLIIPFFCNGQYFYPLLGKSATGVVYATLNPANKTPAWNLSSGNLSFNTGNVTGGVSATKTVNSGNKNYWEVKVGVPTNYGAIRYVIGISNTGTLQDPTTSSQINQYGDWAMNGQIYAATSIVTIDVGPGHMGWGDIAVIGIALDLVANVMHVYLNGTEMCKCNVTSSLNYYPMVWSTSGNGNGICNFGASAFTYTVPVGYNPGVY